MNPVGVPVATPSATVIVARDGAGAPEILMVRRHEDTAFGSADAFPGGTLSREDAGVHARCAGLDAALVDQHLRVAAGGLDYYSAAIRELFEETGLLLATRRGSTEIVGAECGDWREQRRDLAEGRLNWLTFLDAQDLLLRADALHYISHWEAPIAIRPRFSTRFFVAVAPPHQQPECDGREIVDSRWVTPADALHLEERAEFSLPFPTRKHLELLTEHSTLTDLIHWARRETVGGIPRIRGVVVTENGRQRTLLPGDRGYPESES